MRLVDKLGRDEAKHLRDLFICMVNHSEVADGMLNRNKMYKFLINKATFGMSHHFVKNTSTERDRIIYKITLKKYLKFNLITHEEFKDLMLQVSDNEAIYLVEALIETSLRPKWKKEEKKLNKEIIEYLKNKENGNGDDE